MFNSKSNFDLHLIELTFEIFALKKWLHSCFNFISRRLEFRWIENYG